MPEIHELGASLAAISPETEDNSLSTAEKNALTFDVLHDDGNVVATSFGLVFTVGEELKAIYKGFGIDLEKSNGDASYTLPIPATYVIRQDGTVAYHFAEVDYTKRLDPTEVVQALKKL
ncbi:Alkyl hydroperoxide reductase/ Thiol specific antioxidant/ Mal allergen (fragment) [Pseudodesulfovibrio piezophilus C1TLV30]|uniref:Alkyl hydroperoxide reductase/ Thiol specific antioxidant/ Mal allergen n=1 Tax=Pseudodesulfovibrio piezophilus (strain DSM 21447 / JCM 15486 / C1TLV30) TaxID=1322246 RepID=M1WU18_PSEP2